MKVQVIYGNCKFFPSSLSFELVLEKELTSHSCITCEGDIRYHGGWLAPNIYFLGFAGSVLVDGWLRISGASGIWKSGDWKKGN